MTPEERFKVALQADGHIRKDIEARYRASNPIKVFLFSFSKERKINRLKNILKDLEWDYKISVEKTSKKERVKPRTCFYVKVPRNFSNDKSLSSWVPVDVSVNWAKEFIEEIVEWDGEKEADHHYIYYSTDKSSSEVVERIAKVCGYYSNITERTDNRYNSIYRVVVVNKTGRKRKKYRETYANR